MARELSKEQALEQLGREIAHARSDRGFDELEKADKAGYLSGLRYAESLMRRIETPGEGRRL